MVPGIAAGRIGGSAGRVGSERVGVRGCWRCRRDCVRHCGIGSVSGGGPEKTGCSVVEWGTAGLLPQLMVILFPGIRCCSVRAMRVHVPLSACWVSCFALLLVFPALVVMLGRRGGFLYR